MSADRSFVRTRVASRALAVATVCAATVALSVSTAGAATPVATSNAKWERVSTGSINNFTTPALIRLAGNRLVAGWTEVNGPESSDSIQTAAISSTTHKVAARGTIISGWASLSSSPQFTAVPGGVVAAYVGLHSTTTGDVLNGPVTGAVSTDGVGWTPVAQPLSGIDAAGTYGLGLVSDGVTPITGFVPTSTDTIGYHVGYSAVGADDNTKVLSGPGGDIVDFTMARDSATGAVYSAWYTLGGPNDGIHAQQISPAPGPILTAPGAVGARGTVIPGKSIAITTTTTGGIWIGYGRGYPSSTSIRAWNPESNATVTVATGQGSVRSVDLSSGTAGRVWASWIDGDRVKAARSNSKVSRFGGVASLKTPGVVGAYTVTGDGTAGPLDVFVNAAVAPAYSSDALYHAVLAPALTVSATATSFSSKRGGRATISVTDAGAPVPHATIRFIGKTYHANARGKVVVKVAKGTSKGKKSLSAATHGYVTTVTKLTVRK